MEKKQIEHDTKLEEVFRAIESRDLKPQKGIFFEGQVFDAYKFASDLIRSAKQSIILVDNYSHDRFIIIDDEEVYHLGAALKDLGKRWFAFSRFDNRCHHHAE